MVVHGDLLSLDDPLLPRVKRAALYTDDALTWLCESVRAWARGEFVRRMELRDAHPKMRWASDHFEEFEVQREYHRQQVAALVTHVMGTDKDGKRLNREEIIVGLCQPETTDGFVAIRTGRTETVRGVFDVLDIVRWPREYELRKWPDATDMRRVNSSRSVVQCSVCVDTGRVPIFDKDGKVKSWAPCTCQRGSANRVAIEDAMRQMGQMQQVRVSRTVHKQLIEQATPLSTQWGTQARPYITTIFGTPVIVDSTVASDNWLGEPGKAVVVQDMTGALEYRCPRCGKLTLCRDLTGKRPVGRCIHCGHADT